jgi:hypothetical protein
MHALLGGLRARDADDELPRDRRRGDAEDRRLHVGASVRLVQLRRLPRRLGRHGRHGHVDATGPELLQEAVAADHLLEGGIVPEDGEDHATPRDRLARRDGDLGTLRR